MNEYFFHTYYKGRVKKSGIVQLWPNRKIGLLAYNFLRNLQTESIAVLIFKMISSPSTSKSQLQESSDRDQLTETAREQCYLNDSRADPKEHH